MYFRLFLPIAVFAGLTGCRPAAVEGRYISKEFGADVSLTLYDGRFRQVLISGTDSFIGIGFYTVSGNTVKMEYWKEPEEIRRTDSLLGGSVETRFEFDAGTLLYADDPDGNANPVFVRVDSQ